MLVTGHTGFKGSWLSLWLTQLGAKVTGYSLQPPTKPSNFEASRVTDLLVAHHIADIRDSAKLGAAIEAAAPDVIFHLAAQPLVRESYATPRETFDVNVMGTLTLLDCVRATARPCAVISITSDKCYENREHVWGYRESDAMGGFDPYSASKGAAELVIASYRRSFFPTDNIKAHGVKIASARAGNVIGGGDWAKDRILTDAVKALAMQQPVSVRSPHSIRPWQHVLEPLSGYLALGAALLDSNAPSLCSGWNFGPNPGDEANVATLMDAFCKAWGNGEWRDVADSKHLHEAVMLRLSIDKATWELKWKPSWNLEQAVARTARWYRRFYVDPAASMRDACLEDIALYSETR